MIFIGNGALLKSAIEYTLITNHIIDKVYTKDNDIIKLCQTNAIQNEFCLDINTKKDDIKSVGTDKIVFSINNDQILKSAMIGLEGFKFYNVHNGIIPTYRGLPSVCVIYAILGNEPEYGVTLHEIDTGIDTGKCIDMIKFGLSNKDTFESVMLRSIQLCSEIFNRNLNNLLRGNISYLEIDQSKSKLYRFKDLNKIMDKSELPEFKRATNLGIFKWWLSDLNDFMVQNKIKQ